MKKSAAFLSRKMSRPIRSGSSGLPMNGYASAMPSALSRPSDCFSIGSSNVDSIDKIVYEILESNKVGRDLLEKRRTG